MSIYVCKVCGFEYDESKGYPSLGIEPNTKWDNIPDNFKCPVCGASKKDFYKKEEESTTISEQKPLKRNNHDNIDGLDPMILSAICLNLAKGTEKEFRAEESSLFLDLGNYFGTKLIKSTGDLESLIYTFNKSVKEEIPHSKEVSKEEKDRGSLRCLTWAEKVTLIMNGILNNFKKDGTNILKGKKIFVCEICGFISIGETKPEVCPICKVPALKIHEITTGGLK
jgi:rubredoxin